MKTIIESALHSAVETLNSTENFNIPSEKIALSIERTRDVAHGDFASNLAMMLARDLKKSPRQIADMLIAALPSNPMIESVTVAGAGFMNFTLAKQAYFNELNEVHAKADRYGHNTIGQGDKVQVEFVSANPTGPLHVGHGRGAAVGDSLARIMAANGYEVTKEFYYNDAGAQIDNLTLSVKARIDGQTPEDESWPADGYRGDYIMDIANDFLAKKTVQADDRSIVATGDKEDLANIREFAVAYLRHEQDLDLKAFDVNFDVFFLESSLYKDGSVEKTVTELTNNGFTYEQDGALWLRTTDFGDDKDRVMRKKEGGYTYFVPDVAYHRNKWERGFKRVVNEQGADHHGTIARVRAGLQALEIGVPKGWPDYVLHQMVLVMRDGQEVKISKRAGSYVTLRDLIDEVGKDATRYFLVARKPDSQLQFDIDLARSQSSENPVYYIQYAHARICSLLDERSKQQAFDANSAKAHVDRLDTELDYELMRVISRFPEMVISANNNNAPHLIAAYLQELAGAVHSYYNAKDEEGKAIRILTDDQALQDAKLYLLSSAKQVIANGLHLLGLTAPHKM
ncbi:arginine--tRNA ligase [Wohlfahrtiimonas sp. G9077]|uniref:arginine--tRNA ligase n=1 Tax=Wohlfahrtiimonas sp. G9077 TaxID=1980118 RepID=UPI000B986FFC|nr:arginine--tRNA ligase [Wohlfahrtiimonas sp. G9077]OYQ73746.1 arginine--tRNA ligase [Wohlfahrtiimonas sp. G9077]